MHNNLVKHHYHDDFFFLFLPFVELTCLILEDEDIGTIKG